MTNRPQGGFICRHSQGSWAAVLFYRTNLGNQGMGSASAPLQMSSLGALRGCQVPAARLGDFAGLFCLRYRHLGPRNCGHTNHVFKTERCLVVHSHGDSKEILSFYCLYDSQTEPHHAKKQDGCAPALHCRLVLPAHAHTSRSFQIWARSRCHQLVQASQSQAACLLVLMAAVLTQSIVTQFTPIVARA